MKDHLALARSVFNDMVTLRRELHQHPELSGEEHNTLALIASRLDALNIPYQTYENGGICAMIGKGDIAVGIRGDIDALPVQEETGLPYASQVPGVMHACGHDIHTAILLGAAQLFKSMEDELPGMVKLFFQPAEETVGGAEVMVQGGCMQNPPVEHVLALHVDPTLPVGAAGFLPGKMNAAVINLDITVHGTGCHGAHPDQGVDPIVVSAQVINALQTVASRQTAPTTPVVVTIGAINGGTKRNIIPGEVTMQGTVRVLDMDTAVQVKDQIRRAVENTAAAYGAQVEVVLTDDYPALSNDAALTQLMMEEARALLGAQQVVLFENPSMGADDFAYFSNAAKGCYFNIGTTAPGQPPQMLHSECFAPDESCMVTGLALFSAGVWKLLGEQA